MTAAPFCEAQSVLSSITGTVSDSSGGVLPNAHLLLHRVETGTERNATTDAAGNYNVLNLEPGHYDITVQAAGMASTLARSIEVLPRQQLRYDASLQVSATVETVTVNASDVGILPTENAQISAALTPQAVLDLPANYRGAGSTSPINVVEALPGVQPDTASYPPAPSTHPTPSVRFSIQGGLPSQTETTVDGISAQNQTSNNIQGDAFPSADSIAEIRVDGVNNNAEYGQPGEITTITKAGTNKLHGSVYEYLQNQFLDATPYGTDRADKPHKVANDFGASVGGPVVIPKLYNGHNKTFFFGAYEGLRYPQSNVLQARVPTALMRQGNFSQEVTTPLTNRFTGGTYAGDVVPINPSSAPFLQFYPDESPQYAGESLQQSIAARGYNYLSTRRDDISSNQFDVRGDQSFGERATVFARYTFKNNDQLQPADLTLPYSTAFGQYRIFASSFTYAFTPQIANELRFGFTLERDGNSNPFNGNAFNASTGIEGLAPKFFNGTPHIGFNQVNSVGSRLGYEERSRIFQYVDNVTLQRGTHTIRLGADIRHLLAYTEAGGGYDNFYFNSFAGQSATGQEFADFLIGVPYESQTNTIDQDNQGTANSYAFYVQDNWKATNRLTLNFGLRYDYHPALVAAHGLAGNFEPTPSGSGSLIYPAGYASALNVQELANVNACSAPGINNPYATNGPQNGAPCTPVLTNKEAGLPEGLRHASTLRFQPRLGFASSRLAMAKPPSAAAPATTTSPPPAHSSTRSPKPSKPTSRPLPTPTPPAAPPSPFPLPPAPSATPSSPPSAANTSTLRSIPTGRTHTLSRAISPSTTTSAITPAAASPTSASTPGTLSGSRSSISCPAPPPRAPATSPRAPTRSRTSTRSPAAIPLPLPTTIRSKSSSIAASPPGSPSTPPIPLPRISPTTRAATTTSTAPASSMSRAATTRPTASIATSTTATSPPRVVTAGSLPPSMSFLSAAVDALAAA